MLFLLFPLEFPVEEASSSSSLRYDVLQEKRVYFCLLLVLSLYDETSRLIPTSVTMIDRKMVWSLFVVLLSLQWLCVLLSDFFFFLLHFFDTQVLLTKDIWSTTHTQMLETDDANYKRMTRRLTSETTWGSLLRCLFHCFSFTWRQCCLTAMANEKTTAWTMVIQEMKREREREREEMKGGIDGKSVAWQRRRYNKKQYAIISLETQWLQFLLAEYSGYCDTAFHTKWRLYTTEAVTTGDCSSLWSVL